MVDKLEKIYGYIFILPFIFLFILLIIYPLFLEVYYSFNDKKVGLEPIFVGFKNFIYLLSYNDYARSVFNTALFVGLGVNIKLIIALLLANFFNSNFKYNRVVRGLFVMPWPLPIISSLLIFYWMFDYDWGIVNHILSSLNLPRIGLGCYNEAMFIIILFHIWKNLPFWTITLLAGLQRIPIEIYESARVDGASSLRVFHYITLPMIKNLYLVCTILSTIWTLGDFNTVWVLTKGGPADSTHLISTLAFRYGFEIGDLGISSAMIIFILPGIIVLISLLLKSLRI